MMNAALHIGRSLLWVMLVLQPFRAAADKATPAVKKRHAGVRMKAEAGTIDDLIRGITDSNIRITTYATDRHTGEIRRLVGVGGPPQVDELLSIGSVEVLERLIDALKNPKRAWAANAVLSSLTGVDGREVDT